MTPTMQVVRGQVTPEELAALMASLAALRPVATTPETSGPRRSQPRVWREGRRAGWRGAVS
jgi:hypothetical protein